MNDTGLLIKKYRIQKGFTQKQLLDDTYSTTYLSRIESQKIIPSKKFIQFAASRLNISTQDLTPNHSFDEKEITRIYMKFRQSGSISEKDVLLFSVQCSLSYSIKTYLQIYSVLIRYYIQIGNYGKAEELVYQSSRFLPGSNNPKNDNLGTELPFYFVSCGNAFYAKQSFLKADECYTKATKFKLNKEELANLFYNISITKQRVLSNINISLYYSMKAFDLYKNLKLTYKQNRTMITIALQNNLLGNYNLAVDQLNETKSYMAGISDIEMLAKIEYNLGDVQQKLGNYDRAIDHYNKDLEYLSTINSIKEKFYVYRNLTLLYSDIKNLPLVNQYLEKAFETLNEEKNPYSYNEMLSIKARFLKLRGENNQYQILMEKAIENCKHHKFLPLLKLLSGELGKHYYDNRSYKKSAQHLLNLSE